ncbi:hypothetical protein SDC9_42770 [bioreactor metagenome]|uniref:Uncharacterized protein n=1 Tax=bioreactor metagenome TaxID=1076179 RepID=A0A644VYZ5_9ZZZZ
MKIRHILIENFRSIKKLEFDFSNFLVLIGANNSGKSNILRALLFFFDGSVKITPEDVFSFFEGQETDVSVIIEFDSLSAQEKNTFKKYLLHDGAIVIKRACHITKDGSNKLACLSLIYNGWIEEPDKWYLQENAFERLSSKEKRELEIAACTELAPLLSIEGRFTKEALSDFQMQYITEHQAEIKYFGKYEESPLLGRQSVASGTLPEIIFIPAIRELSDETKVNSKTLLGKLLLNVIDAMAKNDADFQKLVAEVEASIERLNDKNAVTSPIGKLETELSDELSSWGVSTSIDVTPPNITKLFELGTALNVDDGVITGAESKGNGLQRAIIFSLLKVIANHNKSSDSEVTARASSESQIYAIEEAELYLHPHKQREFYNALKKISEDENSQVILSTHSSHFVRMDDYKHLAVIRKSNKENGTSRNQCCSDIFDPESEEKQHYKLIHYINPDNGDMFFARKVILVEGESEKVVFPYLAERLNLFKPDVSVIDCGSKFNLPLYENLLNNFEIPYLVIFDEDPIKPEYDDPEKEKSDRYAYEFNKVIEKAIDKKFGYSMMLSPDFEGCYSISRNQGSKLGKGLAALKHFQSLDEKDIPENMVRMLTGIYS